MIRGEGLGKKKKKREKGRRGRGGIYWVRDPKKGNENLFSKKGWQKEEERGV
jgi:hypothetical protein